MRPRLKSCEAVAVAPFAFNKSTLRMKAQPGSTGRIFRRGWRQRFRTCPGWDRGSRLRCCVRDLPASRRSSISAALRKSDGSDLNSREVAELVWRAKKWGCRVNMSPGQPKDCESPLKLGPISSNYKLLVQVTLVTLSKTSLPSVSTSVAGMLSSVVVWVGTVRVGHRPRGNLLDGSCNECAH